MIRQQPLTAHIHQAGDLLVAGYVLRLCSPNDLLQLQERLWGPGVQTGQGCLLSGSSRLVAAPPPGVFFGSDFVTVTKSDDYNWPVLKPDIFAAIMDHFSSGEPLFTDKEALEASDTAIHEDDDEVRRVLLYMQVVEAWFGLFTRT